MALSRNWTALEIWKEAFRGADFPQNDAVYNERFVLINRATISVISAFYDLVSTAYITPAISLDSSAARYLTGTAGWTASTRTLVATLDTSITAGDVGRLVVIRDGTSGYLGDVESVVSGTSAVLRGINLPSADITLGNIEDVIMLSTPPAADVIDISALKIMRYGQQIKLELQSTTTTSIIPVKLEDLRIFRSSAAGNEKIIQWALAGDTVYLKKGSGLSSYGTITIFYPRVPTEVTTDSDFLDVPDGAAIELIMVKLKMIAAERTNVQIPDQTREIERLVSLMYQTFGAEISAEELKEKVAAFK